MKIRLLTISRQQDKNVEGICTEYSGRLSHYVKFTTENIRPAKTSNPEAQKKSDTQAIIRRLKPNEIVVLLDESGDAPSTREFSRWVENQMMKGIKTITFVIGGAFGTDESIHHYVHRMLSLSRLTLPHQIATLVFMEQLYRCFTIIKGEKYHHE